MDDRVKWVLPFFFFIFAFSWASFIAGMMTGEHHQIATICEAECGRRWVLEESRCVCLVPIDRGTDRLEPGYSQ